MESQGRKIHGQAAHAREAGEHLKSLQLNDEAFIIYQKDGDILGLSEIFADRAITFRHLYNETDNKLYLIIAKHELVAAVEIAEQSGNRQALALPYLQLGNVQRELGQLEDAKSSYQKAVENQTNNPANEHNRPGVLADLKGHLAACEYKLGDKSAFDRALSALSDLENSDEPKYNKDVQTSGAHMRIAEALSEDDPVKAKDHLQKAKEIIDSNPDLKLRKAQWDKLSQTFN